MITIANKKPTDRILELGGGDNPHPEADVCVDVRPGPRTHFTADFTQPLPIQDSDFTCVIAHFVLEHLPYRCVLSFLKECHRVLKSGGHAVFAVPNTAEQIKWINSHEGGWDGKPLFEAASELLYGSQNMPGGDEIDHNTHRVYFDPKIAALLFAEAGFVDVVVSPYGERNTDMTIQARKANPQPEVFKLQRREDTTVEQAVMKGLTAVAEQESVFVAPVVTVVEGEGDWGKLLSKVRTTPELPQTPQITISQVISETSSNELEPQAVQPSAYAPDPPAESVYGKNSPLIERPYGGRTVAEAFDLAVFAGGSVSEIMKTSEGRGRVFGKAYFNGGSEFGGYAREGYRDFPVHEITARHILARKPESVLELGCLVSGSPIITDRGVIPIEQVEAGMRVYSHEGQLTPVSRMSIRPYCGDVICIEARYSQGMPLKLTPDHPVYAVRVKKKFKSWKAEIEGGPEWVPAVELRQDQHWLAFPKPRKVGKIKVDPHYARLCGYYLSQGWWQKKWNGESTGYIVSFCFNKKHAAYADDVRVLMKKFFGTTDGWISDGDNAFNISFYSKTGALQLGGVFGKGARNKTIPMEWVVGCSKKTLKQLVVGMYRGDGSKTGERFSYSTSSASMAVALRMVMMRLGVMTELVEKEPREGGVINSRVIVGGRSWNVRASGSHGTTACSIVGIPSRKSTDGRSYWYGREDDKYYYLPIKSLSTEAYDGNVFNMDVEDDHSYSHPTCTVHNCARGYILKRIQDAGVCGVGLEVSRHCYLTRVCEHIFTKDICTEPFPQATGRIDGGKPLIKYDLCYSVATLEHIPEQHLPHVIAQMKLTCKRGLHGIDFGGNDDGFDKTHVTLRDKSWWIEQFAKYAPGWPVEIVDKEELERGEFPKEVLEGDGKCKLNIGSFTTMFHHGWQNIDIHDLAGWAAGNGYKYQRHDVRNGLPYPTAGVDLIFSSHMLEHLTYDEGKRLLSECRRVIKPGGAMRILVPDARLLTCMYCGDQYSEEELSQFDEINDQAAAAPTAAGKLWALLHEGHVSCYDAETLLRALKEAGFVADVSSFRDRSRRLTASQIGYASLSQILRETTEMTFGLSLIVDAVPTM